MKKKINAKELMKDLNDLEAYTLATDILYELENKGYCVWQTYTVEDIADNLGHEPNGDEMEAIGDALRCFPDAV